MAATALNYRAFLNLNGFARFDYTLFVILEGVSHVCAENFIWSFSEDAWRAVPCFKLMVCEDVPAFDVLDVDQDRRVIQDSAYQLLTLLQLRLSLSRLGNVMLNCEKAF